MTSDLRVVLENSRNLGCKDARNFWKRGLSTKVNGCSWAITIFARSLRDSSWENDQLVVVPVVVLSKACFVLFWKLLHRSRCRQRCVIPLALLPVRRAWQLQQTAVKLSPEEMINNIISVSIMYIKQMDENLRGVNSTHRSHTAWNESKPHWWSSFSCSLVLFRC